MELTGFQKLVKHYGRAKLNGDWWCWDYVSKSPRKEASMSKSERVASENAKWKAIDEAKVRT